MKRPQEHSTDSDFAAAAFSSLEKIEVSAQLRQKIEQIPAAHEKSGTLLFWPFPSAWQPTVALAAAALFGVLSGSLFESGSVGESSVAEVLATQQSEDPAVSSPASASVRQAPTQPATEASETESENLEELFALALGDSWQETDWQELELETREDTTEEVTQ